jgi:hypothetical protein
MFHPYTMKMNPWPLTELVPFKIIQNFYKSAHLNL